MKKSKLLVLSLIAFSSISLTACGGGDNSSEVISSASASIVDSSSVASQASQGASSTSEASSVAAQTYVVFIADCTHATVTADKQVAAAGETVTLSYTLDSGYELESISVNGTVISGNTFVMPARSAYIEVKVSTIEVGDYALVGGISENLVKDEQTGVYVARNVKIANDTNVIYQIKNKQLSCTAINNHKTFADIKLPSSNAPGFTVAGGASYDFYYDPTDTEEPCYVKRVSIDELPQSASQLETLFEGSVGSETCVYPDGVTSVDYTSSERKDIYHWDLYSDYSSLATVKNFNNNKEKAVVYKSIDNNVYTVVDDYVENHDGTCITYVEEDDSTEFSAKYDVVNSIDYGHSKYQRTVKEAQIDATSYSHTMESLDFDIMYAYRTGFANDISDDEYKYNIDVKSVANADGTFTTTIDSWVSVKAASTSYSGGSSYHDEFDVTLTFTKAGALLDLNYEERNYSTAQYDLDTSEFIGQGEKNPVSEKYVTASYTYGTAKEGKPTFDTTPYFITSLSNLEVVDSTGAAAKINRNDEVSLFQQATTYNADAEKYVKVDYAPSTALDYWQYGITSTSDRAVINYKSNDPSKYPYDFIGLGAGTTTLTVGNHTKTTGTTASIDVTIDEQVGNVKSIWVYTVYPYATNGSSYWEASDKGMIYAGTSYDIKVTATLSNNSYDQYPEATFTCSDPELLQVTYDQSTGYLTLNASGAKNITESTTVTITCGASYDPTWATYSSGGSKLTVTIKPAPYRVDSVVGTWNFVDKNGEAAAAGFSANMTFTSNAGTEEGYFLGQIDAKDGNDTITVKFEYKFDSDSQIITATNAYIYKNGKNIGYSGCKADLYFDIDVVNSGYIGVYCGVTTGYTSSTDDDNETTYNETYYQLFGDQETDDENYETTYYFDDFSPAK